MLPIFPLNSHIWARFPSARPQTQFTPQTQRSRTTKTPNPAQFTTLDVLATGTKATGTVRPRHRHNIKPWVSFVNALPVLSSKCKTLVYGGIVTGVPSQNDPTPTDKFHEVYSVSLIILQYGGFICLSTTGLHLPLPPSSSSPVKCSAALFTPCFPPCHARHRRAG